jgi:hypothetical protein
MDPYLEQEVVWHDFHERFIPAAASARARTLIPPKHETLPETCHGEAP